MAFWEASSIINSVWMLDFLDRYLDMGFSVFFFSSSSLFLLYTKCLGRAIMNLISQSMSLQRLAAVFLFLSYDIPYHRE